MGENELDCIRSGRANTLKNDTALGKMANACVDVNSMYYLFIHLFSTVRNIMYEKSSWNLLS